MILTMDTVKSLGIIEPFVDRTEFEGLSYGAGTASYDIRLVGDDVAPARDKSVLAHSVEYFAMPLNVVGLVVNKSTLARRFIHQPTTLLEAGWRGHLTLEIMSADIEPQPLPAGVGVAQVIFLQLDSYVRPYDGKYQNQPARPVSALPSGSAPWDDPAQGDLLRYDNGT